MEIIYLPSQLKEILCYTDNEGVFSFASSFSQHRKEIIENMTQKELAEHIFCLTQLFIKHDKFLSNSYIKRLNPKYSIQKENDEEFIVFSANAIAYFGLPGINPKEEVETLFNLFEEITQVYVEFHEKFSDNLNSLRMTIMNSTPILKSIEFNIEKESKEEEKWLNEKNKILMNTIKDSDILTSWLKHTRRLLSIMGSYSWQTFDEESFFERDKNPLENKRKEKPTEFNQLLRDRKKENEEIIKNNQAKMKNF